MTPLLWARKRSLALVLIATALLAVLPGCKNDPVLSVTPTSLSWTGADNGVKTLAITNTAAAPRKELTWQASADVAWLSLTPTSGGEADGSIQVTLNRASLAAGNNTGHVTVDSNGGTVVVNVTAEAVNPPVLSVTPASLSWSNNDNGVKTLTITNTAPTPHADLTWQAAANVPWLSLAPASGGAADGTVQVTLNRATLALGNNNGAIAVTSNGGTATVTVSAEKLAVPSCSFNASPRMGTYPLNVAFNDTSTSASGSIVTWLWNFGDGATSGAQNPTHVYANPGSYTVTLTVTNDAGSSTSTQADYIQVSDIVFSEHESVGVSSDVSILNVMNTNADDIVGVGFFTNGPIVSPLIVKWGKSGNYVWNQLFNTAITTDCVLCGVIEDTDGNYVAVGGVRIGGSMRFLLVKVDATSGALMWVYLDFARVGLGNSIVRTQDGGYAIAGTEVIAGEPGVVIEKLTPGGTPTTPPTSAWHNTSGAVPGKIDIGYGITELASGDLVAVGRIINSPTFEAVSVIKENNGGVLQWNQQIGGSGKQFAFGVAEASNGNLIIAGCQQTDTANPWDYALYASELTPIGSPIWSQNYGTNIWPFFGSTAWITSGYVSTGGMFLAEDGSVWIGGTKWISTGLVNPNMYYVNVNPSTHALVWEKEYLGPDNETLNCMAPSRSGGAIVAGDYWTASSPMHVPLLLRTDANGNWASKKNLVKNLLDLFK